MLFAIARVCANDGAVQVRHAPVVKAALSAHTRFLRPPQDPTRAQQKKPRDMPGASMVSRKRRDQYVSRYFTQYFTQYLAMIGDAQSNL